MTILAIDHVAFPTADAERLITFYAALGFDIDGADAWRCGEHPTFAVVVGDQKLNIHPQTLLERRGEPWYLRAPAAEAGCADLCFVWGQPISVLLELLANESIPVVRGPVLRRGGREGGTLVGLSVYVCDPDSNLLEFISYDLDREPVDEPHIPSTRQ
jgi:catechol 2,3-dioxygenase-like lactoylglutathione lyase family enzyme